MAPRSDVVSSGAQSSSVKEGIVQQLHTLYTAPKTGLVAIGQKMGLQLLAPRSKITVLLIGNHSAGKSTFINWYIEETLQRTGVAMETSSIMLVTSGKKRETLGGQATVQAFPFLRPLVEQAGLLNCITTHVSTSRQKRFPLVTFVDTPGLVDGEMKYAFDIEKALEWLGHAADLVVVFFDPMGQALCKRTLDIVEKLQTNCNGNGTSQKIRFYLSKSDTVEKDTDRQKVILQITQNLCRRPALNSVAFDMPTIYIPLDDDPIKSRVPNQIDDLCGQIDHTIEFVVQNSLNQFQRDCNRLLEEMTKKLDLHRAQRDRYCGRVLWGMAYWGLGLMLLATMVAALAAHALPTPTSKDPVMEVAMQLCTTAHALMTNVMDLGGSVVLHRVGALLAYALLCLLCLYRGLRLVFFSGATLSASQARSVAQDQKIVSDTLKNHFKQLYDSYLGDAVGQDRAI